MNSVISTRRVLARSAGVAFPPIGWESARPSAVTRVGSTVAASSACTASARSCDRCQFEGKRAERMGWLSVCPVTSTLPGIAASASAIRANSGNTSGLTVVPPGSNRPSPRMVTTLRSPKSATATWPALISGARKAASRGFAAGS